MDGRRRGDGAAAKRFSREGHDLNAKMAAEMVEAAGKLVREHARLAEQGAIPRDAVKESLSLELDMINIL